MFTTIKTQDTQKIEIRNCEVGGLKLNFALIAAVAGTAISGVAVDLAKLTLKIKLYRNGQGEGKVIYSDLLVYVAKLDAFRKATWHSILSGLPGAESVLVANGAFVDPPEKSILPIRLDFRKTYLLQGADVIVVEVSAKGWNGATVSSDSLCEFSTIDTQGIDNSDVEIIVESINAGKSNYSASLGSGIIDIFLHNTDKTGILEADSPWQSASIASKQLNMANITYNDLVVSRAEQFEASTTGNARHQNFLLHTGYPLDNVKLDIALNAANVNAQKCYIIYRRLVFSVSSLARGNSHRAMKDNNFKQSAGIR